MPYTLSMALLWVVLAIALGILIGWLMRSVVANRQIERARSNHVDNVDLERLRSRVSELEPVVAERDRLRVALDECRAATITAPPTEGLGAVQSTDGDSADPADAEPDADTVVDLQAAAAVLGSKVALDDLTVVEGIGPKIADLCQGIGIRTWSELSQTEVSLLRTMLADAGPRFRTHDPSTWPEQAALLAAGRWGDFKALTDRLDGGKPTDRS